MYTRIYKSSHSINPTESGTTSLTPKIHVQQIHAYMHVRKSFQTEVWYEDRRLYITLVYPVAVLTPRLPLRGSDSDCCGSLLKW